MTDYTFTAVVPFSPSGDPLRQRNLETVLAWLSSLPIEVIVSELSESQQTALSLPAHAQHLWTEEAGPFSKAAACNAGVLRARTDLVPLIDADTMVDARALMLSAQLIARSRGLHPVSAVRPFGRLVDLDSIQSRQVRETGRVPAGLVESADPSRSLEHVPLAGGILVIDRDTYLSLGGMDESFRGWGGEDDAFSTVLQRSGVPTRVLTKEVAYHLWHARPVEERYGHAGYARNVERLTWWRQCPEQDFQVELVQARKCLGRYAAS